MPNSTISKTYKWRRWIFISAVAVQLLVASGSIALMSSVRVVVSGESLWSKGLAAAVMHLQRYAETGNPKDYTEFQNSLSIPLGVGEARKVLDAQIRNKAAIREGLIQGENHPADVDSLLHILPWVWNLQTLAPTIEYWRRGDHHIQVIQDLGHKIQERRSTGKPVSSAEIEAWRQQIADLNSTVMPLTKQFSASLGNNSRQLGQFLLIVNLLTAMVLSLIYWFSVQRAIAESTKAYGELEVERQRSGVTLAALGDGVITLDMQLRILYANPSTSQLLDIPHQQLLGRNIAEVLSFVPELITNYNAPPVNASGNSNTNKSDNHVHWITRPGKDNVAVRVSITPLKKECKHSGSVVVLHDVSQEQNYMRMLAWQASHDALTGLQNRTAFEQYLEQIVGGQQASLLQLNLDHFKMINATYGHSVGDEVLRQVCHLLRSALRESDVLARIGGDEFAVLLTNCPTHAAMQTAERLRQSVHDLNVHWHQKNLHTGVSIGVVHIEPHHHNDAQSLLGMADNACKHAKESGRNRITVYNPFNRIFQRYQGDMEWVQRLRSSLENNHFSLMAQTVYPLKPQPKGMGGVHFEVLLRLQDGQGQLIAPSVFIPIAERYDLMPHIDRWVVRNALKLLRTHLSEGANISTCSINLSGASLGDNELLEFIRHNILEHGVAAEKLCFEITETSAIASMESATSMITELRKLGCRFSLDDFGSGMASFKYLQQLPVDYLKIDGSFVQDMLKNPSNHAMVEAIHHIGRVLGKHTVAEFVSDAATFEALKAMGVDYAQGFYIAPPVPLNAEFFLCASLPPPQISPANTERKPVPRY
ncbi:EAL domain-containing protein [Comamonas sp.]|uniref:putative bifunctional diguanylate cyclase/phosphodiesterase n=1 Tax=Comamonas sp. TaxID=34028 RepID=UPI00289635F3|nr:EAL domain-containing protein [Comamonas sp.]